MFQVLKSTWALLLGVGLLMIGNGMQGTLLGIRGEIESFSTVEMSIVVSAYFVGFLGGSRMAPELIRRVGHVRVFAALASMVSALIILFPLAPDPWVWTFARVLIGFCFSAVYVTSESWLNNAASNDMRGQALSAYMIVQTSGIVVSQMLLIVADPSGYVLFVVPSILVSLAVTPILLSISPTPAFDRTHPTHLRDLIKISPLGCVGMFLLGGIFSAQFGMSSVYGTQAGLSVVQISTFVSIFFVGALITQFPIGWLSDRIDRRFLIVAASVFGGMACIAGALMGDHFPTLLVAAFIMGGMSNPLYSLLIAHTNDFLDPDDMAGASGGLVFLSGLGAIAGPLVTGYAMEIVGPPGFFWFTLTLFAALVVYGSYRMTQRPTVSVDETGAYVPIMPAAGAMAVEVAQDIAIEEAREESAED